MKVGVRTLCLAAMVCFVPAAQGALWYDATGDVTLSEGGHDDGPVVPSQIADAVDIEWIEYDLVDNATMRVTIKLVDLSTLRAQEYRPAGLTFSSNFMILGSDDVPTWPYPNYDPEYQLSAIARAPNAASLIFRPELMDFLELPAWHYSIQSNQGHTIDTQGEVDVEASQIRILVDLDKFFPRDAPIEVYKAWGRTGYRAVSDHGANPGSLAVVDYAYAPQPWNQTIREGHWGNASEPATNTTEPVADAQNKMSPVWPTAGFMAVGAALWVRRRFRS